MKKHVPDPRRVQVEIKCDRYAVGARWQFGAERLKGDLVGAKVPGYSTGLVWNVPSILFCFVLFGLQLSVCLWWLQVPLRELSDA